MMQNLDRSGSGQVDSSKLYSQQPAGGAFPGHMSDVDNRANAVGEEIFDLEAEIGKDISFALHEIKEWTKSLIPTGLRKSEVVKEADVQIHGMEEESSSEEVSHAPPPLITMSKIEYMARKLFAKLTNTESAEIKKFHESQIAHRANYKDVSSNPPTKAYNPRGDKAGRFMSIKDPETQMVNIDDTKKNFSDKKGVALHALNRQDYKDVKDKEVEGVGTLEAFSFEADTGPVKGAVTPTSYFLGTDDEKAQNHLMNVYVLKVKNEVVAEIRSGKIDTKKKADEFVSLINKLHTEFSQGDPDFPPMRVLSHQLNTFDLNVEKEMINNQHGWMAYANQQLGDKAELVHLNTPSNRYYHTTKVIREKLENVGLGVVAKLIEKYALTGERLSKEQNLEGWGVYANWVIEDANQVFDGFDPQFLQKNPMFGGPLSEIKDEFDTFKKQSTCLKSDIDKCLIDISQKNEEIEGLKKQLESNPPNKSSLKKQIEKNEKEIAGWEKQIEKSRADLKENLVELHKTLEKFNKASVIANVHQQDFEDDFAQLKNLRETTVLMQTILEAQLDIPGKNISRGQELLAIQLLSDKLGVTVAMNCKSGLDRTGFVFVAKMSLKKMSKLPPSDTMATDPFTMTREWDNITLALNKKMTELEDKDFEKWINDDKSQLEGINGQHIDIKQVRQVIEFRKMILDNLIQVGLPITKTSTGMEGLKWSPGSMGENLVPLNFLPSHVMVNGISQPVVNYDPSTGQPTGLTTTGRQLLTKFSGLRGS